ncbi:hypothetical protein ACTA71_010819 [Dictyostelium dimigraforme]
MKKIFCLLLFLALIGATIANNAFIVNWNSDSITKQLTGQVGDTISFYTSDGNSHDVKSSDGSVFSGVFSGSASNPGIFTVTFTKEGNMEFTSSYDKSLSVTVAVSSGGQITITTTSTTTGSSTPSTPTSTTTSASATTSGSSTTGGTITDSSGASSTTGNSGTTGSATTTTSSSTDNSDSSVGTSTSTTTSPAVTTSSGSIIDPTFPPLDSSSEGGHGSSGSNENGVECLLSINQESFDTWTFDTIIYTVYQVNITNIGTLSVDSVTLTPNNNSLIYHTWELVYDGASLTLPTYRKAGPINPGETIFFGYISKNSTDVTFTSSPICSDSSNEVTPTPTEPVTPTPTESVTPSPTPSGSSSEVETPTPTETKTPTPTPSGSSSEVETPTPTETDTPTPTETDTPTPTPSGSSSEGGIGSSSSETQPPVTPPPTTGTSCLAQVQQEVVNSWINGEVDPYIQVRATIVNQGSTPITSFNFYSEAEQIWSVKKTGTNTYQLPSWHSTIPVGGSHTFGYIVKQAELSDLKSVQYAC